jgi:hypothetical protein
VLSRAEVSEGGVSVGSIMRMKRAQTDPVGGWSGWKAFAVFPLYLQRERQPTAGSGCKAFAVFPLYLQREHQPTAGSGCKAFAVFPLYLQREHQPVRCARSQNGRKRGAAHAFASAKRSRGRGWFVSQGFAVSTAKREGVYECRM